MGQLDVVISPAEPRYWAMMTLCAALAAWSFYYFPKKGADHKGARYGLGIAMLAFQLADLLMAFFVPDMDFSCHRSLPLHLCGVNAILMGLNCFWLNRAVFSFTAFMGIIGGAHSLLTPQLPSGDALPLMLLFFLKHAALVFVPILVGKVYGLRFRKWDWIRTYIWTFALSMVIMGINAVLNVYFARPDGIVANYMYVWAAPVADNPLVFDWAWPWYLVPLHVALLVHLILLNAAFRKWSPVQTEGATIRWYQ